MPRIIQKTLIANSSIKDSDFKESLLVSYVSVTLFCLENIVDLLLCQICIYSIGVLKRWFQHGRGTIPSQSFPQNKEWTNWNKGSCQRKVVKGTELGYYHSHNQNRWPFIDDDHKTNSAENYHLLNQIMVVVNTKSFLLHVLPWPSLPLKSHDPCMWLQISCHEFHLLSSY